MSFTASCRNGLISDAVGLPAATNENSTPRATLQVRGIARPFPIRCLPKFAVDLSFKAKRRQRINGNKTTDVGLLTVVINRDLAFVAITGEPCILGLASL